MLDAGHSIPTAIFHASDLRKAVAIAAQVVERRNTIPILGMIRITANSDAAVVRATDLDVEVFAYLEAIDAAGQVDFTISPRLLSSLLRWADGDVEISVQKDLVTLKIDDVEATIRDLCNAETDWPAVLGPISDQISLSEATLHKALTAVIPCISKEETRYYLNGIWLHGVDGKACIVSTDGHRLARYQTTDPWPFAGQIIPASTVRLLHRLVKPGGNGQINLMVAPDLTNAPDSSLAPKQPGNRVEMQGDGWKIITKTIDGNYPDYTRVIPKAEANITATITHHALRKFGHTSERRRAIKIDPVAGRMSYSMPDGPTISMPVQATGHQAICFNLDYLRQFSLRAGTIRLETAGSGDPARVLTDDPALLQILMPMRM